MWKLEKIWKCGKYLEIWKEIENLGGKLEIMWKFIKKNWKLENILEITWNFGNMEKNWKYGKSLESWGKNQEFGRNLEKLEIWRKNCKFVKKLEICEKKIRNL